MMTFECMLAYMHPSTRMVSLQVDDAGVVRVVGYGLLSDGDRKIIERYSRDHCRRMNHAFSRVEFPMFVVRPKVPDDHEMFVVNLPEEEFDSATHVLCASDDGTIVDAGSEDHCLEKANELTEQAEELGDIDAKIDPPTPGDFDYPGIEDEEFERWDGMN